jgi:hypothetical protein
MNFHLQNATELALSYPTFAGEYSLRELSPPALKPPRDRRFCQIRPINSRKDSSTLNLLNIGFEYFQERLFRYFSEHSRHSTQTNILLVILFL